MRERHALVCVPHRELARWPRANSVEVRFSLSSTMCSQRVYILIVFLGEKLRTFQRIISLRPKHLKKLIPQIGLRAHLGITGLLFGIAREIMLALDYTNGVCFAFFFSLNKWTCLAEVLVHPSKHSQRRLPPMMATYLPSR